MKCVEMRIMSVSNMSFLFLSFFTSLLLLAEVARNKLTIQYSVCLRAKDASKKLISDLLGLKIITD